MSRSQIDDTHDPLPTQDCQGAKITVMSDNNSVLRHGSLQQVDVGGTEQPLFSYIEHIKTAISQEPNDITMNVFVRQQLEAVEFQGSISAVARTSFFTAWAA